MTKTYWLSFCDEDRPPGHRFLGVAVVDVADWHAAQCKATLDRTFPRHEAGAEWIAAAIEVAWAAGCNPGGQVGSIELPPDCPEYRTAPRNQLMSRTELRERGLAE